MRGLSCAIAIALVFTAFHARADEDENAAQSAMRRGVAAFGQGDAEGALAAYEEAKRFAPRANLPYRYAAEALVRLGRYPEAVQNLEEYLAKNPDVSDATAVRDEVVHIKREHFPGRAHIDANVRNAHISIDGVARNGLSGNGPSRSGDLPLDVALPPGKHLIAFTRDGYEPTSLEIEVIGDADVSVNGTLIETVKPPITDPVPPPLPPESPATMPWKTIGFATAGIGAAALATAFVLDVTALKDKTDQFKTERDAGRSDAIQLQSDTLSLRNGVVATYIAGGVLAAGGIALVVFTPRAETRTAKAALVRVDVNPITRALGVSGVF